MSLKRMELELNVMKMDTGIKEKEFKILQLKADIKRVEDHITLM